MGAVAGPVVSAGGSVALGAAGAPWFVLVLPVSVWAVIYICRLLVVYLLSRQVLERAAPVESRHVAAVLGVLGRQTPAPAFLDAGSPALPGDSAAGDGAAGDGAAGGGAAGGERPPPPPPPPSPDPAP